MMCKQCQLCPTQIFGTSGSLHKLLRDEEFGWTSSPGCVVEIARRYFDDCLGQEIVTASVKDDDALSELQSKRCGLASLAALLRFLEFHQEIVIPSRVLDISYQHLEHFLIFDPQATARLQIVSQRHKGSGQGNSTPSSLLSLFVCETLGGARLLRQSLLNPLTSIEEINIRLEAVEFLINHETLAAEISSVLTQLRDVDVVLSRFAYKPNRMDEKYYK